MSVCFRYLSQSLLVEVVECGYGCTSVFMALWAQGSPLEGASSKGLREGFAATIYLAQQYPSDT